MPKVLTTASNVTCGHVALPSSPGQVQTSSLAKLKVNGNSVLLESSIADMSIKGCATPSTQVQKKYVSFPCSMVSSVGRITPDTPSTPSEPPSSPITDGRSKKLMVGGMPVMLETVAGQSGGLAGETDGMVGSESPLKGLNGTANQSKLTAV